MAERLYDRHKERVEEGAEKLVEHRKMLRDFVGPGGIKLNREEQLNLYLEALNSPEMMLGILQSRQQERGLRPEQVPRDFVNWIDKMRAMAGVVPQSEETGQ